VLLTLTTTHHPATDLGFLLHKNPSRTQSFDVSFGRAHVTYPEAGEDRCTAALVLDVDPVALVRRRRGPSGEGGLLRQYVNDRPYAASSFLSVAISRVFGSALGGRCNDRPDLVDIELPLEVGVAALPCRGGEPMLRRLFGPLGYEIEATQHALDDHFPDWGPSDYFDVTLRTTRKLKDVLAHLYVLVPVLDDEKHYWITKDEVEKLLHHGGDWLASHPDRELIVKRYLKYQRSLADEALARLVEDEQSDPDAAEESHASEEEAIEAPLALGKQRLQTVVEELKLSGVHRVIDLGCGEGRLLAELLKDGQFQEIVGMDVSHRSLGIASERLHIDRMSPVQRSRISLINGSLIYRDRRLGGFDAATVVEVVEHLDPARLAAFERVVFEFARPLAVILTTPNAEYNSKFEGLPVGTLRHRDHRFEWTRAEFEAWAHSLADRHGYQVRFRGIGSEDPELGMPTQMGVFTR
jgi:3' terminal RNA ribose 2'-O-methyltransferase Hen1